MSCWAIIVAAGEGRRLGGLIPKPYQPLRGRALLLWSLEALEQSSCCDAVVVVVAPQRLESAKALLSSTHATKLRAVCPGGDDRAASVEAGLSFVPDETELVAVHDAARPLLSTALVSRVVAAAAETGAAIPVLPVRDTVRTASETGTTSLGWLDRRALRLTQTPQVFRLSLLRRAYARLASRAPDAPPLTDDAQLVEELGQPVRLVEGELLNFKITERADLEIAEQLLGGRAAAPRAGVGYDVHRLVPGRPLVLGGVEIEHAFGLLGHSDADVLSHAIGDAILGAAALGDLGHHFPPSEPLWRGARSLELLALIEEKVAQAGLEVINIDAVLLCETPPIAPHAQRIRENLASVLRVPTCRVSVKATTNERLGFVGREEGIACFATALLSPSRTTLPNHTGDRLS